MARMVLPYGYESRSAKPHPEEPASYLSEHALVELVRSYDPSVDKDLIKRAYACCKSAHGKQLRHSGDPYYAHPIAVAEILAALRMDVDSICTALLHDVLEDTHITEAQMQKMFGSTITDLVKGVTKLGQLELSSKELSREGQQAENFQKFVLAMSKDVRVLLVKLCDRLHNMRTLHFPPKKIKPTANCPRNHGYLCAIGS